MSLCYGPTVIVLFIPPVHGSWLSRVDTGLTRGTGEGLRGGIDFGAIIGFTGEPLDTKRPLIPARARSGHFRLARLRGLYPLSLIWKELG